MHDSMIDFAHSTAASLQKIKDAPESQKRERLFEFLAFLGAAPVRDAVGDALARGWDGSLDEIVKEALSLYRQAIETAAAAVYPTNDGPCRLALDWLTYMDDPRSGRATAWKEGLAELLQEAVAESSDAFFDALPTDFESVGLWAVGSRPAGEIGAVIESDVGRLYVYLEFREAEGRTWPAAPGQVDVSLIARFVDDALEGDVACRIHAELEQRLPYWARRELLDGDDSLEVVMPFAGESHEAYDMACELTKVFGESFVAVLGKNRVDDDEADPADDDQPAAE